MLGRDRSILRLTQRCGCHRPAGSSSGIRGRHNLPSCDSLKGIDDVFVSLRTGFSEAPRKLPAHFTTTLRCVPHYGLYSDYDEYIDGRHVSNALDEIDPDIVATHSDFQYYRRLLEGGKEAFTQQELSQWSAAKNTNGGRDSPGWRLDKWKFLPLAEKALRQKPDAKWYIFIESDTYILWQSMLEWLSHFDPSEPHYMGMQMQIGDVIFAYGGGGIVISNPALTKVVEHRKENQKFYDEFTAAHWAGDCVLGKTLADAGVKLLWSYPNLAGDQPNDVDFNSTFGGADKKPWCYYAASYHHIPPTEFPKFANFEYHWSKKDTLPPHHRDVFRYFVLPYLTSERIDWDNLSDTDQLDATTLDDCRSICENDPYCLQFSFSDRYCKTSTALKLGHQAFEDAEERVISGWIMDRVKNYAKRMDATCNHENWILP
ncbi:glycosyltransferase family 31 protein [Hypoxylon sp. CI-4A]|nr:glycosyltransferase family 31 protein [Hypoxylon sp. CI-4A]